MDEETPRPGYAPGTTGFRVLQLKHESNSPMDKNGRTMNIDKKPKMVGKNKKKH